LNVNPILLCLTISCFAFVDFPSVLAQSRVHDKKLETVKKKNTGFLGKKRKKKLKRSPGGEGYFNRVQKPDNPKGFSNPGSNFSGRLKGRPFENEKAQKYIRKKPRLREGYFNQVNKPANPKNFQNPGANFSGNLRRQDQRGFNTEIANFSGTRRRKKITNKMLKRSGQGYTGHLTQRRRGKYNKAIGDYSGNYTRRGKQYSKAIGDFSGNYTRRSSFNEKTAKRIGDFQGNRYRRKKNYGAIAYYGGDMAVKHRRYQRNFLQFIRFYFSNIAFNLSGSPEKQLAKKNKAIAGYTGSRRYRRKDLGEKHPTSRFVGPTSASTRKQKERRRERQLWFSRLFLFDNQDQPKDFKKKIRKPRYDKKEHEIWND